MEKTTSAISPSEINRMVMLLPPGDKGIGFVVVKEAEELTVAVK